MRSHILKRVIIGTVIILMLVVPIFSVFWFYIGLHEKVRIEKCTSNLRQVHLALQQYASDNNETFAFVYDSMEPFQAFGMLYHSYISSYMVFSCPSSKDEYAGGLMEAQVNNKENAPFILDACRRYLGYAYSFNKDGTGQGIRGPWKKTDNSSIRIVADKYATHDYNVDMYPEHKPINHQIKFFAGIRIKKGTLGGRNFVRIDGSTGWESNLGLLDADPGKNLTGADWWSDPPDKP
jgi:hypothetical protein